MYWLRIQIKLILREFISIPSFCKRCGRDVTDFIVSDETWEAIYPKIKYGNVLCYDCFCNLCAEEGLPPVSELPQP